MLQVFYLTLLPFRAILKQEEINMKDKNSRKVKTMKTFNAVSRGFDPCYGFKIIPAGMRVEIHVLTEGDIRLPQAENQTFPGFGYRLDEYEAKNYFAMSRFY